MRLRRAVLLSGAGVALIAGGLLLSDHGQASRDVRGRSDHFWGLLAVNGSPRAHFETLDAMAAQADLIVVGRIERVTAGREVRDLEAEALGRPREEASVYFADATVTVEEAIKGLPVKSVRLQLLLPGPGVLAALQQDVPTERAIYFLTDMGAYFAKEDPGSGLDSVLKGTFDFVSPQGLLRDFGGATGVTADEGDAFLQAETRKAFSDVIAETKRAASG